MTVGIQQEYIAVGAQVASKITLAQTANDSAITIDKTSAGAGDVLTIGNNGTGYGIHLAQTGAAIGLNVSNTGTLQSADFRRNNANATQPMVQFYDLAASTVAVQRNYATGVGACLDISALSTGPNLFLNSRVTGAINLTAEGQIAYDSTLHAIVYHNGTTTKTLATV